MAICRTQHLEDVMKIRDAIKLVEAEGWRMIGQEGSHREYRYPVREDGLQLLGIVLWNSVRKTKRSLPIQAELK